MSVTPMCRILGIFLLTSFKLQTCQEGDFNKAGKQWRQCEQPKLQMPYFFSPSLSAGWKPETLVQRTAEKLQSSWTTSSEWLPAPCSRAAAFFATDNWCGKLLPVLFAMALIQHAKSDLLCSDHAFPLNQAIRDESKLSWVKRPP